MPRTPPRIPAPDDALAQRHHGLQVLQTISRTVAESLDIDRILNDSLDLLMELMEVDAASIYVIDEKTSEVLAVPSRGVRKADLGPEQALGPDPIQFCSRAARGGRVLVVRRPIRPAARPQHGRHGAAPRPPFRTYAGVPLSARHRVLGVLYLTSRLDHRFSAADLDVLEGIGSQIGLSLENARMFQEANQRNRVLAALNAITQVVGQSPKLEESLGLTLARILEVMSREGGSIYLRDGEGPDMVLAVHRVHPGHFLREPSRVIPGEGELGQVLETGRILVVPPATPGRSENGASSDNALHVPFGALEDAISPAAVLPTHASELSSGTFPAVESLNAFRTALASGASGGFRSFACVPLRSKGELLGILKVGSFTRDAFSREEVQLLEALGTQLGVALENAIQFRTISEQAVRLSRRAGLLSALLDTSHLMAGAVDLQESLPQCLSRVGELLNVPRLLVTLDAGEGEADVVACFDADGPPLAAPIRVTWSDFPHGRAAMQGVEPVLIDVALLPLTDTERGWMVRHAVRTSMLVPIVLNGHAVGLLTLSSTRLPRSFTRSEVDFGQTVANQIAMALERSRLFTEVRDFASSLEGRVEARTRELREANMRLQEITRQRSDFLSVITHELRTPLNAILGFSEIMCDPDTDNTLEEMREYSVHVYESGRHLLRTIDDILDLANPRSRSEIMQMERLHLEPLLHGILDVIRPQAVSRSVTLRLDVAPDHPPAIADRVRLKQILYNLLSNAVKFSPPKGTVTLGARPEGRRAVIWVQDEGPGIDPVHHDRIFEPFYQIDQTISRSHEGAGLGLALARRYVHLHGGDLEIISEVGRGSRFQFTIALGVTQG